jgi:hypothetical protein
MKRHSFVGIALVIMVLAGCTLIGAQTVRGSGHVETQERTISPFTRIDFAGLGNLEIEPGYRQSLRVEAEKNLLPYLETDVLDGTLRIAIQRNINLQPSEAITFFVTAPTLDAISVSGLGRVRAPQLEADRFTFDISGGGDIVIAGLQATQLDVSMDGLGNLEFDDGQVEEQTIEISGGGSYRAGDLASSAADISISGLGNAVIRVADRLDVTVSGSGVVQYIGNPQVTENISGLGRVEKVEQ